MLFLLVLWFASFDSAEPELVKGSVSELCKDKTVQAYNSGNISFHNSSLSNNMNNGLGCVMKLESCSSCQIELELKADQPFQFFCKMGHSKYCSLGCDYLNIFDMYYMNETNKYYSDLGYKEDTFRSESSSVFIMLCHGGMAANYSFQILYRNIDKLKTVVGTSDTSSATGFISSPYFPLGYAQNHETYRYEIKSTLADDFIQLIFDDWHLSETSSLYFINSNRHGQFSGDSNRPVIISDSNLLKFTFNTGVTLTAGENRDYLGFRASYRFYKDRALIRKPNTDCKGLGYLMTSSGGRISFSPSSPTRELYDCLWVVKTQDGFDGMFLKIIKLRSSGYLFRGDNELTIRAGVSSLSPVRSVFDMLDNIDNGIPHFSKTGFYIRLNASLSSSDSVILTFASYKTSPGCGSELFVCGNDRCIDRGLMCDGYDQCGDNSDEVEGCSGNTNHWDKSYQYTITIGVIVPMVISVFLIMVICLLFVMIRRCRRARLQEVRESSERLPTVSEDISGRRRRRHRRRRLNLFGNVERDSPPTYDEAIQNPPGWYLNVAFGNPVDPSLPQPPSYHEATGIDPLGASTNQRQTPGSPTSTDSSQSEVTVCSGNLSDSSSSSDDESNWDMYNGDGEGRRGRLGRHVSSLDSDSGMTEQHHSRSVTNSPSQSETVSTSVETSTEIPVPSEETLVEMQNVESAPKVDKDNNQVHEKAKDKKKGDSSEDFVVPAGPKPGGSDPQLNDCRPKVHSAARRQDMELQSYPRLTSAPVPTTRHSNSRNLSSGSEVTAENVKRPKKKPRKSKSKKIENQDIHVPSSNRLEGYSYAESMLQNGASNIPDVVSSVHEKPDELQELVQQNDIPCLEETVIENRHENSLVHQASDDISLQASDEQDAGYQVVVNVDNDDFIVVYDSLARNNKEISQPYESKDIPPGSPAPLQDVAGATGISDLKSEGKYSGEPAAEKYGHQHTGARDQEQEQLTLNDKSYDKSVRSVELQRPLPASSDKFTSLGVQSEQFQVNVQQSHKGSGSNDHNEQSFISLTNDLEKTEDIYV